MQRLSDAAIANVIIEYAQIKSQDREEVQKKIKIILARAILWLDIDGVVNSDCDVAWSSRRFYSLQVVLRKSFQSLHEQMCTTATYLFCPEAMQLVKEMLFRCPDLKVGLSSQWRLNHNDAQIAQIFEDSPWLVERYIDKTKDRLSQEEEDLLCDNEEDLTASEGKNRYRYRGSKIDEWHQRHPWVTQRVIFDDLDIGAKFFGKNFIHVDPTALLRRENIERAVAIIEEGKPYLVLKPQEGDVPIHTRQKIRQWLHHQNVISQTMIRRVLYLLARYRGPVRDILAQEAIRQAHLFIPQFSWHYELILELADKEKAAFLILELYHKRNLNVKETAAIMIRLDQAKIHQSLIKELVVMMPRHLHDPLFIELQYSQISIESLLLVLSSSEYISVQQKNRYLIDCVGFEVMEQLIGCDNVSSVIKTFVRDQSEGNISVEKLLLFLVGKEISQEAKNIFEQCLKLGS